METRMIKVLYKDAPPSTIPHLDVYRHGPNGPFHSSVSMKKGEVMKMMKKSYGFTLMELMMVVAIISIAAAVSGFTFNRMLPDMRVKAAAKEINSDLNLARLKAVRENATVTIDFNNDKGYEIYMTGSDDAKIVLKTVDYPDGVTTEEDGVSFSAKGVSFDGRGMPDRIGHIYLVNEKETFSGVKISFLGKTTTLYKPE